MNCTQQIQYVIRAGDNLYQLSRHYRTTVPAILQQNPGTDPYNLKTGTVLTICPGESFTAGGSGHTPPSCPSPTRQIALINAMRLAWEQHLYWTRMLITSLVEHLKDTSATQTRLLRNPGDLGALFGQYYSSDTAAKIAQLITEHLQVGGAVITAIRDGKKAETEALNQKWTANADEIADYLADINPYYGRDSLRDMLHMHLDYIRRDAALRTAGQYPAAVDAFDRAEKEMMHMADYLSSGLMQQFPQKFM